MAYTFGRFVVALVLGSTLAGCSGGGGGSGGHGAQPGGSENEAAPADDYSSMLVGHWFGRESWESVELDITFFPDGRCDWLEIGYDDEVYEYTGWSWSVSGADQLPDMQAPWILQRRAIPGATAPNYGVGEPDLDGKTTKIVAISPLSPPHRA